jgi:hypothetical protein
MHWRLLALSTLLALPLAGCAGSAQPSPARGAAGTRALPGDLSARVREAEQLGRAIFEQDLASTRATQAVLAAMEGAPDQRIKGWITRREGSRWTVQFFSSEKEGFASLWEVKMTTFGAGVSVDHADPPRQLDAEGQRMARARTTAAAQPFRACSERYDTVVLPASLIGGRGYIVYLLASTGARGEWMVGGHQRFLISADGSAVVQHQPLSRGCLAVPASRHPERAGAAWVTHVVSDSPVETHVFLSLLHQAPLFVGTRRGIWKVAGQKISFAGER